MPLNISVKRKYLPALSSELSLPSSHRSFRGNRKPAGGGPAGVAEREEDVENVAAEGESLHLSTEIGGAARLLVCDSLMRDLVDAMADGLALWQ
jgi:hypothetical protein